jgi:hypothetical protein
MGFRGQLSELPAMRLVPQVGVRGNVHDIIDGAAVRTEHATGKVTPQAFVLPDGTKFNRAPKDMGSWELLATYRLAWHLAWFLPSAKLAQPLANWLCSAQQELETRGEWQPEALPPLNM